MSDLLREIRWEQWERYMALDIDHCVQVLRGNWTVDEYETTLIFLLGLGYV